MEGFCTMNKLPNNSKPNDKVNGKANGKENNKMNTNNNELVLSDENLTALNRVLAQIRGTKLGHAKVFLDVLGLIQNSMKGV